MSLWTVNTPSEKNGCVIVCAYQGMAELNPLFYGSQEIGFLVTSQDTNALDNNKTMSFLNDGLMPFLEDISRT